MSKSIFIFDTPRNCYECPLCVCDTDYDYICSALTTKAKDDYTNDEYEIVTDEEWAEERYSKCPLKRLPQKLDANYWHRMFSGKYEIREAKGEGYNFCLNEILGEEEWKK